MLYCPKCSTSGPFTQEGLSALLVRLGLYICLNCMGIVRPVDGAPAANATVEKSVGEQAD